MTSKLFSPIKLRDIAFDNRIVVSPMCQYSAVNGRANDWHLMNLGQYCIGGGGLLIAEATAVSDVGRITHDCLGLYDDACEEALRRVVDFCSAHGVAKLGIQLAHAGRKASVLPPGKGASPLTVEQRAWQTVAPSAIPYAPDWHTPKALDAAGLDEVKAQFVRAAERSVNLGFALAELHVGHGYLLHQFLSPLSNQRDDAYGGSTANRMRFPLEVFAAVRAVWPTNQPVGVRVSATDWVDGGWTLDETVQFAQALKEAGCDFIDVTTGGLDPRQKIALAPGYQVAHAARVRRESGLPTMAVGLITEPQHAEQIIASGEADFVALARGMMFNPRWAWHAAQALGAQTAYPPNYARCAPVA